jgi:polyphosphate kinase
MKNMRMTYRLDIKLTKEEDEELSKQMDSLGLTSKTDYIRLIIHLNAANILMNDMNVRSLKISEVNEIKVSGEK